MSIVLKHGDMVTAAGFLFAHDVMSVEGYAAEKGWSVEERVNFAVGHGNDLACVSGHIVVMVGDKAEAISRAEKARRDPHGTSFLTL